MKFLFATKLIALSAVCMLASPVFSAGDLAAATPAVQVNDAWVRATVPGQKGSGAFFKITAKAATRLVGISSPVAGVAEVHEMKMEGDVMKMRALTGLDLPAGKTVELKSGGYHLMLMDLKQTLVAGSSVPVTLMFKDAQGQNSKLELRLPVGTSAPAASGGGKSAEPDHSAHKH